MNSWYKTVICFCFIFATTPMFSQELIGVASGNYAGSAGTGMNPTSIINSKNYLDIQIVGADFFAENNLLYIHKEDYNFFNYISSNAEFPEYGDENLPFDYYRNKKLKHAYTQAYVKGPSAMLSFGNHAFAISTGVRSLTFMQRLPHEVINFAYQGLGYPAQLNINYDDYNISSGALAWGEVGFTWATVLHKYFHDHWTGGITVKRLFGYSGAYEYVDNINYIVYNDSTINIRNLDGQVGFSLPVDYENNDVSNDPFFKGGGWAMDLGVTYKKTKRGHSNYRFTRFCEVPYEDYHYKIGLSLIDFGTVNFKQNAQKHNYESISVLWEGVDTLNAENINQMMQDLSTVFYGNPTASLESNRFSMWLPTALSLQFDYHYYQNWFIHAMVIHPVRFGKNSLRRPAVLAITPRYESQYFDFYLPVNLYEYRKPRIGIAARFWFLTIGSENLGGFFNFSDFTGLDFYASLKFNFLKGKCGRTKVRGCYNQEYGYVQ